MHSYRNDKNSGGWQAGYRHSFDVFTPLGPIFNFEYEAAAYASFLNGGRYCPDEIAPIFDGAEGALDEEDDDSIHPDRPKELEDYPLVRTRK